MVDFLRSRGCRVAGWHSRQQPRRRHIGGFEDVLGTFEVANVYLSGDIKGPSPTTRSCAPSGTRAQRWSVTRGDAMDWGGTRPTRESKNLQPLELALGGWIGDGVATVELC